MQFEDNSDTREFLRNDLPRSESLIGMLLDGCQHTTILNLFGRFAGVVPHNNAQYEAIQDV